MTQTNYPLLTLLYHIYALGEDEEMSTNADAYFARFGLSKTARSLLKNVQQGGSPSPAQVEKCLELLKAELVANPITW